MFHIDYVQSGVCYSTYTTANLQRFCCLTVYNIDIVSLSLSEVLLCPEDWETKATDQAP